MCRKRRRKPLRLRRSPGVSQCCSVELTQAQNRTCIHTQGLRIERAGGDIIHAERVRGVFRSSAPEARRNNVGWGLIVRGSLAGLDGPFNLMTEIAEVFGIDAKAQDFIDHWKKVRQRANRAQWRGVSGTDESPCHRQDQGIFDRHQRHTALMQLGRQKAIRPPHGPHRSRCLSISVEDSPNILVLAGWILLHSFSFSPVARGATARR